jgi:hypothetical protein
MKIGTTTISRRALATRQATPSSKLGRIKL